MLEKYGNLTGTEVTIQRSDGRRHSAVIAYVINKIVKVEWEEDGDTKGKEIDLSVLIDLNKHLAPFVNHQRTSLLPRRSSRSSVQIASNRNSNQMGVEDSSVSPWNATMANHYSRDKEYSNVYAKAYKESTSSRRSSYQDNNEVSRIALPSTRESDKIKSGSRETRRQKLSIDKREDEISLRNSIHHPNRQYLKMIEELRSEIDFKPLCESDEVITHQITVCVRKRPLNKRELNEREIDLISVPSKDIVIVHEPKCKVDLTKYLENQKFRFDCVFDETCSNDIVYNFTARPLLETIFSGGMATCFAYGQTGSGKTHTMGGSFTGRSQDCTKGIYAMVATDIFKFLSRPEYEKLDLITSVSYFELYGSKLFDLLNAKSELRIFEDGKQQVRIVPLKEITVSGVPEVMHAIRTGNKARTSGQTSANPNSSRSHAVFQIVLRYRKSRKIHGKFSLIDLAGSERGADTSSSDRSTRMEGAEINKSLLALKECIRALDKGKKHLPFRASKLTQVLRDSFIGENSKTCMIATISPGMASCEHSLNTLRYADRVKELSTSVDTVEEDCESALDGDALSDDVNESILEDVEEILEPTQSNGDSDRSPGMEVTSTPDDPSERHNGQIKNQTSKRTIDYTVSKEVLSCHESSNVTKRKGNRNFLTSELYNIHSTESQLHYMQEELFDSLQKWCNANDRNDEKSLFESTKYTDYNKEGFASDLIRLLNNRFNDIDSLRTRVKVYIQTIGELQVLSNNISNS